MARLLFGNFSSKKGSSGITSFEAFCISLSGRVGTGNVVGVATAIALGGPGAVFWMWMLALLGASTALLSAVQSNSVASAFDNAFHIDPIVTAAVVVVLLALVVIGGVKRIAMFASVVTPFMALGYIGISLVIIAMNWRVVPDVLALIFKSAFGFGPVFGA